MNIYVVVPCFILIIGMVLVFIAKLSKREIKEQDKFRESVEDLRLCAEMISTIEEVRALHAEVVAKGNSTYNPYIAAEINRVEAYLQGMYKILNKK